MLFPCSSHNCNLRVSGGISNRFKLITWPCMLYLLLGHLFFLPTAILLTPLKFSYFHYKRFQYSKRQEPTGVHHQLPHKNTQHVKNSTNCSGKDVSWPQNMQIFLSPGFVWLSWVIFSCTTGTLQFCSLQQKKRLAHDVCHTRWSCSCQIPWQKKGRVLQGHKLAEKLQST